MSSAFERALSALKEVDESGDVQQAYAGENKAATTRARKAFLKAKKALHEARQEVQSIKKGEQNPTTVPTFFDTDDSQPVV